MKKLILTCAILLCSIVTFALPIEINIPANNIKLNLDGVLVINKTSDVSFTFTDTGEQVKFTPETYQSLRKVLDKLYGVKDALISTDNLLIQVTIPSTQLDGLNELLQGQ